VGLGGEAGAGEGEGATRAHPPSTYSFVSRSGYAFIRLPYVTSNSMRRVRARAAQLSDGPRGLATSVAVRRGAGADYVSVRHIRRARSLIRHGVRACAA
jgi:hypothetical protein